ncbi:TPA: copper resistance protein NlpE N-terminal domain-containing protein [Vibrio alginolyticus]
MPQITSIPCEDYEGTVLLVELNESGQCSLSRNHIGKFSLTVMEEGTLSWDQNGNIVTIEEMQFLAKEQQLLLLGAKGQPALFPSGKAALLTKDSSLVQRC